MAGLEIRIPYVSYKTKVQGFPYKINVLPTEMSIQKNLLYYSNKVKLQTNLLPLNTTENDIEWSILEGNNYCSINASTGELTIDSSAITQMVKVRAKSVSNQNLIEEREIVLTHREQPIIEDLNFDINISGLQASYNYIDSSTTYSFTAALDPSVNGYNVVFDVIEGNDYFNITDINWENNQTAVTFTFNEPNEEDTVITLRFCLDKMQELTKDVSFNLKTLVSDIIFDNIPESPYIPYELYSFDFSTEPIINFRNLDVSVISGEEYLDNWYTGNVVGTSGKFYFKRNSVEIPQYELITVGFADPLDNTIHEEVSLIFDNINHVIDVSGNKASYGYNSDKTYYESFTWEETPNYNRELQIIVTQNPANIIDYYTSDVSGGSGRFNFQTKSVTDEGWVNVRILDPLTTLGKNVTFNIQNEKVARYMSIWDYASESTYGSQDSSYMRNVNAIAYGNNLQKAIRITGASPYGYDYFVYDTSDNNFWNEMSYGKEPQAHYTSVNLFDTSLQFEFDYIPANTNIYYKDTIDELRIWPGFYFVYPTVLYEFDSSRNINYPKTVDISTNLPAGTYAVYAKELRNSSREWEMLFEIGGQDNYMILDSSHIGNNIGYIVENPIAIHSDIPHIKIEHYPTTSYSYSSYSYFDPSANIVSTYFNNIQGNKEITISYVLTLRSVSPRPEDTDEYFYVFSGWNNIETLKMTYTKWYAPTVIDYVRNNLHLSGNIARILYNDTYTGNSFMDAVQIGDILNNMKSIVDPSLPYKMRIYPNLEYDSTHINNVMQYEGFTSGMVGPLSAGTYDIEINYKADIVPIDYTINVKVNVQ